MGDRVFCIDFGSAFTKVALRRDPGADAELLKNPVRRVDEADFSVPSVAVVDRSAGGFVIEFGDKAANRKPGNGIFVHQNWKKAIFADPPTPDGPTKSPLEALLGSDEFKELAARFGVPAAQVQHVSQLVSAASALSGVPARPVPTPEMTQHKVAASLAPHFFNWLRKYVLDACSRLKATGLNFEAIPVRLAVPAFAGGRGYESHPGCAILLKALTSAGWPVHPDRPVVTEPYSNVVGILTKATNVLHKGRVHIGNMFSRGPLITVLKDAKHHTAYRALVIDVGAFTTDFAALDLNPGGKDVDDPDVAFSLKQHSVALGVGELDAKVFAALPKEKGEWLKNVALPLDLVDFQHKAYGEGKSLKRVGVGTIGAGVESTIVRDCVVAFGEQLAAETVKFCDGLPPFPMQELILTGGGSNIPAVRAAIQKAAQLGGRRFVKIHAPDAKKDGDSVVVQRLDETFTRGGSALGGASIYFEKSFY